MANFGQDMLDKIRSNKGKDANEIILEQTKGTLTGSGIGLLIGLYIGFSRNYNMFFSGVVGALAGGLISKAFISKNKEK
jgi:outer membrane lipoprotein SlyB